LTRGAASADFPETSGRPTLAETVERIEALRRQRLTGQQMARELVISPATVSRVLRRLGLNRIAALEPAQPVRRDERERPGKLIPIDIKKLGRFERAGHRITGERTGQSKSRGIGREYLHLAVDDHSRLAYSQILPDEKRRSFPALSVQRLAVLPPARRRGRARHDRQWLPLQIAPLRQSPAPPWRQTQANPALHAKDPRQGRALRPSLAARSYETSEQRRDELSAFLFRSNWQTPRTSLNAKPPISRIGLSQDSLLRLHSEWAAARGR
jgi:hypothetical protein